MTRLPSLFLAHGAPPLLDDPTWMAELRALADGLPRPRAVLMVSAHWEDRPLSVGATETLPLIYDFYGFPQRYYQQTYPAPGAPELAARVRALAAGAGLPTADAPERGWDHGAYVPLVAMYPDADVPVLQISLPTLDPRPLLEIGRVLAPLRDEGVLIVGSGFLTHNLRFFSMSPGAPVPGWAREFDDWVAGVLAEGDLDALVDFERKAPAARIAHPRTEHFVPVMVAAGAAVGERVGFPITGFVWGGFTKRTVTFG